MKKTGALAPIGGLQSPHRKSPGLSPLRPLENNDDDICAFEKTKAFEYLVHGHVSEKELCIMKNEIKLFEKLPLIESIPYCQNSQWTYTTFSCPSH